ncbi:type VI secretion system protein TssL, long form [Marinobacter sp. M1N3S26]|uniref:type VI secretion system protein TssL, long form n=1 Tax=Marinobacter sp. M1N3S26 TaxID=3382299 RepID=UPI00387AC716
MNDSTVIKPRPGARQVEPRPDRPSADDDRTLLSSPSGGVTDGGYPTESASRFRLPSTQLGPICDEASRLLSVANRLSRAEGVEDMTHLRRQCMDLVREYRTALKAADQSPETVDVASYCVCALLDEIVLNSTWGQSGQWAAASLLSEFHSQTWSGTHFFELVDKARRTSNIPLMMLQYLCLSLGFKGRYRVEERGEEQLDILRDCLYHEICADQGRFTTPFDRGWEDRVTPGTGLTHGVPLWVGAAICAVALLLGYLWLTHQLNAYAEPVLADLNQVGIPERPAEEGPGNPDDLRYLRQMLQTEIDRGLVELDGEGSGTRLRIGNEALFAPGGVDVSEDMVPVISKIARALESTSGSILVTGHTDNRPIATSQYPSNWHLSLARATSVSDMLGRNGNLKGRLWPEGRGEAEPLFKNDTAENRARNRRVEILLVPET